MAATAFAQTQPLTVTAMAGTPISTPTAVGQQVMVPLSAAVSNAPGNMQSYTCPISGPLWSWSTQDPPPPQVPVVQYAATSGAWGPAPQGSYSLSIQQFVPDSPDAALTVTFQQAGYWRISPLASVSYTDSPCSGQPSDHRRHHGL